MDYRLTDPYLDPPGTSDDIIPKPRSVCPTPTGAIQAPEDAPDVDRLRRCPPGMSRSAALNNFAKVNDPRPDALGQAAAVRPELPAAAARAEGSHRDRAREALAEEGIAPNGLRFAGYAPLPDYFAQYGQIDIALDTFPYAGGTTTCDALVDGRAGGQFGRTDGRGRGGLSILSNVGLPELAAHTEDEYVKIAADLANDLPRLAELRRTMRERMQASPLMDAPALPETSKTLIQRCGKYGIRKRAELVFTERFQQDPRGIRSAGKNNFLTA